MRVEPVEGADDGAYQDECEHSGSPPGTVARSKPAHGGTGQRSRRELHDDARQPTPRGVEVSGGQQQHHRRQRDRDRQQHEAACPRRSRHPEDHQRQQAEHQVGQPFRADRPGWSVPAGSVEVRLEPQLRQEDLADVAGRRQLVDVLGRDVSHVEGEDDPQCGEMQRDQVDGPHARQPKPQEVQRGSRRPRPTHSVDVRPRQHEAAQDEEQVDALGATVEQRCDRRREIRCCRVKQGPEVK